MHGIGPKFNKMKLTILGRGNAGCLSALHFAHFTNFTNSKVEIEMVYDSKIKPVPTGQGTTIDFPRALFDVFQRTYLNNFPFTMKTGIMYENFGKKNKEIFHPFELGRYAIHFEPSDFQDFVCSNLKINFKEIDENIQNYDSIDSDYIIDCRGTPKNLNDYEKLINPLNCALLANIPKKENDVKWTRSIATKNGWCFYIPLPEKTSLGYIFNSNITSLEDAQKDFENMFDLKKINKVFPFSQYVAKEPIINDRVLLNGNRLFFLEPLEATAMGTYMKTSRFYFDYIFNNVKKEIISLEIKQFILKIQNFILWHYSKGSRYDTVFWEKSKELWEKNKDIDLLKITEEVKNMTKKEIQQQHHFEYAQWGLYSIKIWYDGVY